MLMKLYKRLELYQELSKEEDIFNIHYGSTGLSSFQAGGTNLEIFLPKNQHTQRKLLNFENWCSGDMSKSDKI